MNPWACSCGIIFNFSSNIVSIEFLYNDYFKLIKKKPALIIHNSATLNRKIIDTLLILNIPATCYKILAFILFFSGELNLSN